jgi:hypothetical protein
MTSIAEVVEEDIFSIDAPPRVDVASVQENDDENQIKQEEMRKRVELNNKFIIEGYRSYVNYMKSKIQSVMDGVREGHIKRIHIDIKHISVTIDDKTREFPFDFFHYGKRNGDWKTRVQPWTEFSPEFSPALPQFPFKNLQISCMKINYYLQDLSDPSKGRSFHILLSPKILNSPKLWHGFEIMPTAL